MGEGSDKPRPSFVPWFLIVLSGPVVYVLGVSVAAIDLPHTPIGEGRYYVPGLFIMSSGPMVSLTGIVGMGLVVWQHWRLKRKNRAMR
jgi:hypothetical protein